MATPPRHQQDIAQTESGDRCQNETNGQICCSKAKCGRGVAAGSEFCCDCQTGIKPVLLDQVNHRSPAQSPKQPTSQYPPLETAATVPVPAFLIQLLPLPATPGTGVNAITPRGSVQSTTCGPWGEKQHMIKSAQQSFDEKSAKNFPSPSATTTTTNHQHYYANSTAQNGHQSTPTTPLPNEHTGGHTDIWGGSPEQHDDQQQQQVTCNSSCQSPRSWLWHQHGVNDDYGLSSRSTHSAPSLSRSTTPLTPQYPRRIPLQPLQVDATSSEKKKARVLQQQQAQADCDVEIEDEVALQVYRKSRYNKVVQYYQHDRVAMYNEQKKHEKQMAERHAAQQRQHQQHQQHQQQQQQHYQAQQEYYARKQREEAAAQQQQQQQREMALQQQQQQMRDNQHRMQLQEQQRIKQDERVKQQQQRMLEYYRQQEEQERNTRAKQEQEEQQRQQQQFERVSRYPQPQSTASYLAGGKCSAAESQSEKQQQEQQQQPQQNAEPTTEGCTWEQSLKNSRELLRQRQKQQQKQPQEQKNPQEPAVRDSWRQQEFESQKQQHPFKHVSSCQGEVDEQQCRVIKNIYHH